MDSSVIETLRDLAISFEHKNIYVAYRLMQLARNGRPKGKLINTKLNEYRNSLIVQHSNTKSRLKALHEIGEVAFIPIGFRCYTRGALRRNYGISQPSLPFDNGFFSPHAIASILEAPTIDINDNAESRTILIKEEGYYDDKYGLGIRFRPSSYDEINEKVASRSKDQINKYLDSTFGYYTLDNRHKYVLAHYNWHKYASPERSGGCHDSAINLRETSAMLNRRLRRMLAIIYSSKHVVYCYFNKQDYKYMKIGNTVYPLGDFTHLEHVIRSRFGENFSIMRIDDSSDEIEATISRLFC